MEVKKSNRRMQILPPIHALKLKFKNMKKFRGFRANAIRYRSKYRRFIFDILFFIFGCCRRSSELRLVNIRPMTDDISPSLLSSTLVFQHEGILVQCRIVDLVLGMSVFTVGGPMFKSGPYPQKQNHDSRRPAMARPPIWPCARSCLFTRDGVRVRASPSSKKIVMLREVQGLLNGVQGLRRS
ncbi:unnamed protein product, partial [Nesidiocoris tenuis]